MNTQTQTHTKRSVTAAMLKAGITGEVTGKGRDIEIELPNDSAMRKFRKDIAKFGGYKTGYGTWVLRPGYTPRNLND